MNELCSRFYAQFFYYSWSGALALVLLFVSSAWVTRRLIRAVNPHRPVLYLHWVPSILLLALHSNWSHPAALSLGLLWILLGAFAYLRLAPLPPWGRAVLFCLLQATLYYVTAGQAFLFALIAIGHELLRRRSILLALFCTAFAAVLPYAGASTVFTLHLPDAYTTNLIYWDKYYLSWPARILYACFPLLLLWAGLRRRSKKNEPVAGSRADRWFYHRSGVVQAFQGGILLAAAVVVAVCFYEAGIKRTLLIDYYARRQDWNHVLRLAEQSAENPDYVQYQANRALYHCGLLCDRLFSFVQHSAGKSLFLQGEAPNLLPLQHSDIFFDLGLVSEAQHWAHEAIAVKGDSPWNLQRLVEVNLLKGDRVVAGKYLDLLDRTLWFRTWAKNRRQYLADANAVGADPQLGRIRSLMPKSDFLLSPTYPALCLPEMIKDPENKMAFEYYMRQSLLDGDLSAFVKELPRLNRLGYQRIPRHFEEAILVYLQLTGGRDQMVAAVPISGETRRRFDEFNSILAKHNGDRALAYAELLRYRDTYWFYGQYFFHPQEQ
jgi:hypothetical protein